MKQLYLTSSVDFSAKDISKKVNMPGARLLFVTTASEPDTGDLSWLKSHRAALVTAGFVVTDYTITNKTSTSISHTLSEYDILYMSGGNGLYLLEQIQKTHCASVLKKFVESGHIYIGSSAGSYITAPNIYAAYTEDSAKAAPRLQGFDGLGLVDFMIFPHWGNNAFKNVYFGTRLEHAYDLDNKIVLLTDNQYIEVKDDFYRVVDVRH